MFAIIRGGIQFDGISLSINRLLAFVYSYVIAIFHLLFFIKLVYISMLYKKERMFHMKHSSYKII